ncbi:MAG TPA: HD-GYP domain-containing protein [Gemmatimonadaceae bacterium]
MNSITRRTQQYVLAVSAVTLLATVLVVRRSNVWDHADAIAAAFFFAFGLLAQFLGYRRGAGRIGTIAFLPYLSIAALAPNGAALACVVSSVTITEIIARREPIKLLFNVSQHLLAVALAILVYTALGGESLLKSQLNIVAFIAMFATYMTTNRSVVSGVLSIVNRTAFRRELYVASKSTLVNDVLAFPLVLIFAVMYARLGYTWSALLALPMVGVRQLYKTVFDLERINEELLQLMVAAIEARDPYTSGHSQRVARYSRVIARLAGLSARKVEQVGTAALLHDVGKIHEEFAPILRKPGRLNDVEFEVMKTHSAKGATLVGKVTHFSELIPMVRAHHEKWSGKGYPDGLAGDEIPLGARVITIADTIDAMTTARPYRPARTLDEVREEISRMSGIQFDPRLCDGVLEGNKWSELCLEVEIAAREFPADGSHVDMEDARSQRPSMEFPTH